VKVGLSHHVVDLGANSIESDKPLLFQLENKNPVPGGTEPEEPPRKKQKKEKKGKKERQTKDKKARIKDA